MSKHVVVGTPIEEQNQPKNHSEHGIAVEKQVLADKAARRDEARPAGVPFTTPSPKIYAHMEPDANPVSHESSEPRAVGKPHIVAPPPSNAEILQSEGKTYPRKEK
jgi:hypothetical protein